MACYTPAGRNINAANNLPDGALYAPCNISAPVSMCCAIGVNRTYQDVCIDGGLCHNAFYGNRDQYWRESCTDPTWKDPACVKLFVNGTGINATEGISLDPNGNVYGDIELTNCGGGMWCYGENNIQCCRQNQGVYVLNGEQVDFDPASTASSSSSTSSATSSTPSSSATSSASASGSTASEASAGFQTPAPTAAASHSNGLSTGAQAGIGVGVGLGVLLLALIALWLLWRRRKRNRTSNVPVAQEEDYKPPPDEPSSTNMSQQEYFHHQVPPVAPSEIDGNSEIGSRYELPATREER